MRHITLFGIALCVLAAAACGKSSSPTAPTPITSTTRVMALEGSLAFGDVQVGQTKDLPITIRNSGTGTLNVGDLSGPASVIDRITASIGNRVLPPGGSTTLTIRFTPTTTGALSGTITLNSDQTSGPNTLAFTGNGVAAPTLPITVVGVVTDAATRAAIGGVTVSAIKNDATAQSFALTTTDGNGFYSIVVQSATAISLSFSKTGYTFQHRRTRLAGILDATRR